MHRSLVGSLVALFLVSGATDAAGDELLADVNNKLLAWSTQAARERLQPAFDAKRPDHLVAMGRILEQEGKYADAAARLTEASKLASGDPQPWIWLGEVRLRQQQEGAANEAFRRAAEAARGRLSSNGDDALAHLQLGIAEQRQKHYEAAMQSLQQARQRRPQDAEVYYQLGVTRAFQERWQEAFDLLSQALERNSGIAYAHYYRGLTASRLNRKDILVSDLDRFVTMAPKAPEADRARKIVQSASR